MKAKKNEEDCNKYKAQAMKYKALLKESGVAIEHLETEINGSYVVIAPPGQLNKKL